MSKSLAISLFVMLLFVSKPVLANEWVRDETRFTIENDCGTGDKHYTNGIRYEISQRLRGGHRLSGGNPWTFALRTWFPGYNESADPEILEKGWALGQNIYTPEDIDIYELIPNDRPYATVLYFARFRRYQSPTLTQHTEFELGIAGPMALGESVQKGWHEIINVQRPNGWDNQIKTWPVIQWSNRVTTNNWYPFSVFEPQDKNTSTDEWLGISGFGYVSTGTKMLSSEIGGSVQIGWRVQQFRSRINDAVFPVIEREAVTPRKWHAFFVAKHRAYYRPWSIFIDGTPSWRYERSHHVPGDRTFAESELSGVIGCDKFRLIVSHIIRGPEFDGDGNHRFWSLSIVTH